MLWTNTDVGVAYDHWILTEETMDQNSELLPRVYETMAYSKDHCRAVSLCIAKS